MALKNPNAPRKVLADLQTHLLRLSMENNETLLKMAPVGEEHLLEYYSDIRKASDKLYTLALRMSQISATAMDSIQPGSSDQKFQEDGPQILRSLDEDQLRRTFNQPTGGNDPNE